VQGLVVQDQQVFNSWAENCINEWNNSGRNINPLLKQFKKCQVTL